MLAEWCVPLSKLSTLILELFVYLLDEIILRMVDASAAVLRIPVIELPAARVCLK